MFHRYEGLHVSAPDLHWSENVTFGEYMNDITWERRNQSTDKHTEWQRNTFPDPTLIWRIWFYRWNHFLHISCGVLTAYIDFSWYCWWTVIKAEMCCKRESHPIWIYNLNDNVIMSHWVISYRMHYMSYITTLQSCSMHCHVILIRVKSIIDNIVTTMFSYTSLLSLSSH